RSAKAMLNYSHAILEGQASPPLSTPAFDLACHYAHADRPTHRIKRLEGSVFLTHITSHFTSHFTSFPCIPPASATMLSTSLQRAPSVSRTSLAHTALRRPYQSYGQR